MTLSLSDLEYVLDDEDLDLTRNRFTNFLETSITDARNGNLNPSFLRSVSQFTEILSQTGIEGPWETKSRNLALRATKIGDGSQFTVFKERPEYAELRAHPLVIKRVNVDLVRAGDALFATSQDYQFYLRALGLEVMALTNPSLRSHPNLVRLVAWGYDYPYADMPVPTLYVEAALMPLSDFLAKDSGYYCSVDVKYQLSLDIANGIEALHQLRIVHGDLKPDNVLVFRTQDEKVPFRGKLSDFGVCIDLETPDSPLTIMDYRGTPKWLAPEVLNKDLSRFCPFLPDLMFRFDAYSFGLTVVSIFANHGQTLADTSTESVSEVLSQALPFAMRMKLRGAILRLLAEDPRQRPLPSAELLKTDTPAYTSWLSLCQIETGKTLNNIGIINPIYNKGPLFWQRTRNHIIKDLIKQYDAAKDDFTGSVLFGMAQAVTGYMPHVRGRFEAYLTDAAAKGHSPARAVHGQIMSAREQHLDFEAEVLEEWAFQAVSQGYLFSPPSALTADRKARALKQFRDKGGFCMDPFLEKSMIIEAARSAEGALRWIERQGLLVDQNRNTILHAAAALGRTETVRALVQSDKVSVDVENDDGETPLYKAAQAGHAEVIKLLLQWNADASRTTRQAKISALHWLFMLPETSIPSIASHFIASGADVNAVIQPVVGENADGLPQRLDLSHYPFELPYGTPLHWAALFRNIVAMEALIEQGAKVDATYHYSDSGSRPLALAAWLGDLEVAECLIKHGADPSLVDSKARNVLHTMTEDSPALHGFLPRPWHAWIRHGRWETYLHRMNKLIQLLVDAGADINAKSKVYNNLTPIATAADPRAWDGAVIIALLEAGADIEGATLSNGTSVLHSWAEVWGDRLNYPCSYIPTFKRIATAMLSLDVRLSYDLGHKTPLHSLSHGHQPEDEFEQACEFLLAHDPPADLDAQNRQGHTALSLALMPPSNAALSQDLISFGNPAERGLFLLEKGASPYLVTNDGQDILYWIAENKLLSDEATHNLLITFLERINTIASKADGTTEDKTSIHETYKKHFLPKPGATQTLFASVSRGKLKSTTLLLSLGLKERINDLHPARSWTALDQALSSAERSRRMHIEIISTYKPNTRPAATASKTVFDEDQGPPDRAAEAYYALPGVIRYLRDSGARRKCELETANIEDMDGTYIHQPQEYDWAGIYGYGSTPATQPHREQWQILYDLGRYRAAWKKQIDVMADDYAYRVWRPDVRFIEEEREDELVRKVLARIGEVVEGRDDGAVRVEAEDPGLGGVMVTVIGRRVVDKVKIQDGK